MPETIKLTEAAPGVAVVAFNRPDVANALSTQMGLELLETWTALKERDDLRCVRTVRQQIPLRRENTSICTCANRRSANSLPKLNCEPCARRSIRTYCSMR